MCNQQSVCVCLYVYVCMDTKSAISFGQRIRKCIVIIEIKPLSRKHQFRNRFKSSKGKIYQQNQNTDTQET